MASPAHTTILKILESLPEAMQERVLEHMQEYIEDIRDEFQWNDSFRKSQGNLAAAARRARDEIRRGLSKPLKPENL